MTWFSQKGVPTGNVHVSVVFCLAFRPGAVANALTRPPPQLTEIFPFSAIQPGGGVIFKGTNLGTQTGRLLMTLQNDKRSFELQQLQWSDTSVGGTIPDQNTICGIQNQPVFFQAIRPDGQISNAWMGPQITVVQDFQRLPPEDVQSLHCDQGNFELPSGCANCGCSCMGTPVWGGGTPCDHSIRDDNQACVGFCSGTDKYGFSLRNGWVFDSWQTWGGVTFMPFMQTGNPNGELDVKWSVQGAGSEPYWADLYVTGPVGCPGNAHPWR